MNNKIKCLMVAIVAVISILSCKKEIIGNDGGLLNSSECTLVSLQTDFGLLGVSNIKYIYDASGRLIKENDSDGEVTTLSYSASKITYVVDGEEGEVILSDGRAISSKGIITISVNGVLKLVSRTYTYNIDGYLATVKSYVDSELSHTDVFSYTNGNLSKSVSTFESNGFIGKRVITTNFSYLADAAKPVDVVNPLVGVVDYLPGGYFGKSSKNVLAKAESETIVDGVAESSEVMTYSYKFDSKGNATSVTLNSATTIASTQQKDEYSVVYNLIYNCK